MLTPITAKERLIFALDVSNEDEARQCVQDLEGIVSFYKVGWELFLATGLNFVKQLRERGHKVFLDVKITPDIEETLRRTIQNLAQNGVEFITIHGNGKTAQIVREARRSLPVKILSVTVLTSMDHADMRDLYISDRHGDVSLGTESVEEFVMYRAEEALTNGCDGLIASGLHGRMLRDRFGDEFLLVCPGIRPGWSRPNGHKRPATPTEAIKNGADYLVVGRPIRDSSDRRNAAQKIVDEIEQAVPTTHVQA